jgi:hypothetical protein
VAAILAHFESVKQIVDDITELALIVNEIFQPIEIPTGALLDQGTPQINQFLGRRRRSHTCQTLTHHERQRILDRRIGALGDLIEFAAMKPFIEHRREVLRDAIHASCANRFHASLLHCLEHCSSLLTGRLQTAMQGLIVTGKTQGD